MPRYLILDTETSGLHMYAKKGEPPIPADHPDQPRLASVAMLGLDENLEMDELAEFTLIRPEGWEIKPDAAAVNGLTTERCLAEGINVRHALASYTRQIRDERRIVVAFNAQFDTKIMRGELRRAGMDDLFMITPNICAMRAAMKLGVQKRGEKKGGFPKLSDVYWHFFQHEIPDAHDARADVMATVEIFRELMKIGACPEPAVHRSATYVEI